MSDLRKMSDIPCTIRFMIEDGSVESAATGIRMLVNMGWRDVDFAQVFRLYLRNNYPSLDHIKDENIYVTVGSVNIFIGPFRMFCYPNDRYPIHIIRGWKKIEI